MKTIRVVLEIDPTFYVMLHGVVDAEEAERCVSIEHGGETYYRAKSNDRWALYKPALTSMVVSDPLQV